MRGQGSACLDPNVSQVTIGDYLTSNVVDVIARIDGVGDVTVFGTNFPKSRAFIMFISLAMLAGIWLLLTRTRIGLVIQAALTHPEAAEALGHNVPRVFMLVFGGGAALAGLAGVVGGNTFITEPAMAGSVGAIIFVVVVVGGMGSLSGAFLASILIGLTRLLPSRWISR